MNNSVFIFENDKIIIDSVKDILSECLDLLSLRLLCPNPRVEPPVKRKPLKIKQLKTPDIKERHMNKMRGRKKKYSDLPQVNDGELKNGNNWQENIVDIVEELVEVKYLGREGGSKKRTPCWT